MTATVTPLDRAAAQRKRRTLFFALLGAVLLPALVAAVLPNAQADDTVYVAADTDQSTAPSEAPTSATQPSTTATTPSPTAPHATSTTAKPKSTTTTTKPKSTTTTAAPKAVAKAAAPAPAPTVAAPAPAPGSGATAEEAAFLACVRKRESGGNYSVVSSNGLWYGAYQMTRSTWDSAAQRAGRPDLVGTPPNQASPADQDYLALVLYRWLGKSPWGGAC